MPGLRLVRRAADYAGPVSSLGLALSGIGIAAQPSKALASLDLATQSSRGTAETRAGLGGTFAALGLYAVARGTTEGYRAVGVTWLGAGVARSASLWLDDPPTPPAFWLFLALELTLGVAGLAATPRRR